MYHESRDACNLTNGPRPSSCFLPNFSRLMGKQPLPPLIFLVFKINEGVKISSWLEKRWISLSLSSTDRDVRLVESRAENWKFRWRRRSPRGALNGGLMDRVDPFPSLLPSPPSFLTDRWKERTGNLVAFPLNWNCPRQWCNRVSDRAEIASSKGTTSLKIGRIFFRLSC